MDNLEVRSVEVRSVDEDKREISGLAVPYNQTTDVGGYKERFEKGAFGKASDVKLFYGHSEPIGLVTQGRDTDEGYVITARISDTPRGNEVYTLLKDGVLNRFSVGFMPVEHRMDDDVVVRTKATLKEVSVVPFPAYEGAKVSHVRETGKEIADALSANENKISEVRTSDEIKTKEDIIDMSNEVNDALQSEVADLRDFAEGLERRLAMVGQTKHEEGPVFRSGGEFLKALADGSQEARDFGTTVEADVTRPGWVSEALRRKVENRNIINLFSKGALPASGNSIEYPFIKSDTGAVASQAAEGAALAYLETALDTATAPVKTYGGYISVSRQAIERSDLAYLEASIDLMVQSYAKATNDAVRDALVGAKGVADHTLAADNATSWIDLVVDAAAAIEDNTVAGVADFMIVSRDVFKRLAHMVDSGGRPVFNVFGAGVNNVGSANIVGATMNVGGLEVVVDGRLAANSAYVCNADAIKTFESAGAPFRLQDENIINLTKDFSLYGYLAIATRDVDGIRRLDVDLVA